MDQGPNQINMPFDFVFPWQMPNRSTIDINYFHFYDDDFQMFPLL